MKESQVEVCVSRRSVPILTFIINCPQKITVGAQRTLLHSGMLKGREREVPLLLPSHSCLGDHMSQQLPITPSHWLQTQTKIAGALTSAHQPTDKVNHQKSWHPCPGQPFTMKGLCLNNLYTIHSLTLSLFLSYTEDRMLV